MCGGRADLSVPGGALARAQSHLPLRQNVPSSLPFPACLRGQSQQTPPRPPPLSIACSVLCTLYPGLSLPLWPEARGCPGATAFLRGALGTCRGAWGLLRTRSEEGEEEALHRTNSVSRVTATPAQIYLLCRHASKKTTATDAEGRQNSRSNGATCSYLRIHVTGGKGTGGLEPPARQGRASLPVRLSQAQRLPRGEARLRHWHWGGRHRDTRSPIVNSSPCRLRLGHR